MITAAQAVFEVLEAWGVRRVYGLPGGSLGSAPAGGIEFVTCRTRKWGRSRHPRRRN